jgi:hypothetical protein
LLGSKSFQYPTTTNNESTIEGTAASLTFLIQDYVQPFMVDPNATFASYEYQGVDAGLWFNGTSYLLLVVNMNSSQVYAPYQDLGLGWITNATEQVQRVFSVFEVPTASGNLTGTTFQAGGIGIHIATP